jgi:hypothetical protein
MRIAIAATAAGAAALLAASTLGVASAEAPTPPASAPVRTVSVGGVANVAIPQGSSAASATAVYRQGMAAAVSDGQSKAEFLASKAGATLGSVQSVVEDGGSISCSNGEENGYVEYQGEQPDFGSPSVSIAAGGAQRVAKPPSSPAIHKPAVKKRRKGAPTAKKATVAGCMLDAQVTLVYAIS